jgi:glycosyltransferase involved in cell wall biosynthesis
MLGWQESLHNILAIADIVVVPSLWEGLPYVALEAMALKRPVVASRVNGLCELITDGHDGLLVPAGEPEPLSKTLIKLIGSADQRRDLGCAARATIVQQYSRELMLHHIQEIYEKLG